MFRVRVTREYIFDSDANSWHAVGKQPSVVSFPLNSVEAPVKSVMIPKKNSNSKSPRIRPQQQNMQQPQEQQPQEQNM